MICHGCELERRNARWFSVLLGGRWTLVCPPCRDRIDGGETPPLGPSPKASTDVSLLQGGDASITPGHDGPSPGDGSDVSAEFDRWRAAQPTPEHTVTGYDFALFMLWNADRLLREVRVG